MVFPGILNATENIQDSFFGMSITGFVFKTIKTSSNEEPKQTYHSIYKGNVFSTNL